MVLPRREPQRCRERLITVPFRKVIGAALAGALVLAIAPSALAQSDDDAPAADTTYTIDVTVGLQGYAHPDEPVPVVVDITSEELIVGRLDIGAGGATQRTAIEVPANSAKQYVVYGAAPGDRRRCRGAHRPDG